jgi:hypothetical protein
MSRRPWTEVRKQWARAKEVTDASNIERRLCMDCRSDTFASEEYYMLRDGLWRSINADVDGMLCLACAERRLRRGLMSRDFTDAPINGKQALKCPRLAQRLEKVVPRKKRFVGVA